MALQWKPTILGKLKEEKCLGKAKEEKKSPKETADEEPICSAHNLTVNSAEKSGHHDVYNAAVYDAYDAEVNSGEDVSVT